MFNTDVIKELFNSWLDEKIHRYTVYSNNSIKFLGFLKTTTALAFL